MRLLTGLLFALTLASCASTTTSERTPIDQVPMYGGLDRSLYPELKRGDEEFISAVTEHYGGREAAAQKWVEQAFAWHQRDNWQKAMQRFNQAWLLDPKNPEVYWGFSALLYEKGENCEAMEMGRKAEEIGLEPIITPNRAMFLADLGMITSVCSVDDDGAQYDPEILAQEADELFIRSEEIWTSEYLYDKWWQGLYWRGLYAEAWEKVELMRSEGGEPYPEFLEDLEDKMPEPQN